MGTLAADDSFNERVKLLLVDTPQRKTPEAKWPRGCPEYFVSAFWWAFFVASTLALVILFSLVLVAKYEEKAAKRPIYVAHVIDHRGTRDQGPNAKSEPKELLSSMLESSNNVFFLTNNNPLNWRSSCSLESILIHSPDKNVFLLSFTHDHFDGVFEKKLRSEYSNLMMLKVDGEHFFKDSMFDGEWRNDDQSLQKAAMLTIWQFGGSVLNADVVLTAQMPKADCWTCLVSEDLVSCPIQCAAYIYQLIVTFKNNDGSPMDEIVRESVKEFCGNPVSCPGVQLLPSSCSAPTLGCFFVKIPDEPSPSHCTWQTYHQYCPVTYSTYQCP